MEKKKKELKWYDDGHFVTNLIIITILLVIVCSQSFAVIGGSTFSLLSSVINHNSVYVLVLVYFALLKFHIGKKYFNYLNIFLIFIYFLYALTSLLTVVQSFSLITIIDFLMNTVLFLYLVHTLLRDSSLWKELNLGASPFNEITNDVFYCILVVLVAIGLIVNLISTVVISGLLVAILDAIYVLLFARYIYLYRDYLDDHGIDSHNKGNFDEVKEKINEVVDNVSVDNIVEKIKEGVEDVSEKVEDATEKVVKKKRKPSTKKKGDE